jgi:hypothetical protein
VVLGRLSITRDSCMLVFIINPRWGLRPHRRTTLHQVMQWHLLVEELYYSLETRESRLSSIFELGHCGAGIEFEYVCTTRHVQYIFIFYARTMILWDHFRHPIQRFRISTFGSRIHIFRLLSISDVVIYQLFKEQEN